MGSPASTSAVIEFKTTEQTIAAIEKFGEWLKLIETDSPDVSSEFKGDYGVESYERDEWTIIVEASSSRYQNLEWQVENMCKFFRAQEGCESFSADIMIMEPTATIQWDKSDEE